jgi:hypothetical protein
MSDTQLKLADDARKLTTIQNEICVEKKKKDQEGLDENNYIQCVKKINAHIMIGSFETTCFSQLTRKYIDQLRNAGYNVNWDNTGGTKISWWK